METVAYSFILFCLFGLIFTAIFFREPPKVEK